MEETDFKEIRHRFYKLGKKRNMQVLVDLGKLLETDTYLGHDEMKDCLNQLKNGGRLYDLVQAIKTHEEEIKAEKEDNETKNQNP